MAEILVLRPDEKGRLSEAVTTATRGVIPDRPLLGLVSNGKPFAREVLELLAQQLAVRLRRDVETELVVKPSAGMVITDGEAALLAARAHLVLTGVGD
jgi:hypothetical protein